MRTTGKRYLVNMLSAVSPTGAIHFLLHEGRVDAGVFIEFCERLRTSCGPIQRQLPDGVVRLDGDNVTLGADGLIAIDIPSDETAEYRWTDAVADLDLSAPHGRVVPFLQAKIVVVPRVIR